MLNVVMKGCPIGKHHRVNIYHQAEESNELSELKLNTMGHCSILDKKNQKYKTLDLDEI